MFGSARNDSSFSPVYANTLTQSQNTGLSIKNVTSHLGNFLSSLWRFWAKSSSSFILPRVQFLLAVPISSPVLWFVDRLPSRELKYPTLEKRNIIFKRVSGRDHVSSQEVIDITSKRIPKWPRFLQISSTFPTNQLNHLDLPTPM